MAPADIERRALAIFERLGDHPRRAVLRDRLLRREEEPVRARVAALERTASGGLTLALLDDAVPDREAPERIGPFRLVSHIGDGGMGSVWLAERDDGLYDQRVAIKLIHHHLGAAAAVRFAGERRILARLEHPNIARVIDGGVTGGDQPYLVMEHVAGLPIDAAASGMPLKRRIDLLIKAADAVQFAHAQLVVHADLKPSNILVDGADRVKLLDFGIARLLGQDGDAIAAVPMTPAYASPERIAGEPSSIADDVHALGRILAELTDGETDADLRAIAARAMAPGAARYAAVGAMISDLERWRERLPVSARPSTISYRAGKFLERHRLGVAATALAMLLLAGIGLIATVNYRRAEQARGEAAARVTDLRGVARYLLFDLQDAMERQPRSLRLREQVANVSQSYLDRLARRRDADPVLRLEAAEGLRRLAERQGQPGRANLGQPARATRNLARAAMLARPVDTPAGWRLLAAIRIDQAGLAIQIDNDFPRAETYLGQARAALAHPGADPGELTGRYLLALATLRQWQDRYPEALTLARRAAAAPPPADPLAAALFRARLLDNVGESYAYMRVPAKAVAPYRRQLAILESAHRRWPEDNRILRRLVRARWALATNYLDLGAERPLSLALLEQGSREGRALVAAEPDDADAQRILNINENARAQALAVNGRMGEAVTLLGTGVERRRAILAANPNETQRARDLWVALTALGDLESEAGQLAAACAHYAESHAGYRMLARAGRLTPADVDYSVRLLNESIGRHCRPRR